ncbi:MAG: hypothetical protein ACPGXK_11910 [Phycisphaerae bacterium]
MKFSYLRATAWCVLAFSAIAFLPACEQSSHRSTRMRTYNDDPDAGSSENRESGSKRSESDELDGEYKMQGEGEMSGG